VNGGPTRHPPPRGALCHVVMGRASIEKPMPNTKKEVWGMPLRSNHLLSVSVCLSGRLQTVRSLCVQHRKKGSMVTDKKRACDSLRDVARNGLSPVQTDTHPQHSLICALCTVVVRGAPQIGMALALGGPCDGLAAVPRHPPPAPRPFVPPPPPSVPLLRLLFPLPTPISMTSPPPGTRAGVERRQVLRLHGDAGGDACGGGIHLEWKNYPVVEWFFWLDCI